MVVCEQKQPAQAGRGDGGTGKWKEESPSHWPDQRARGCHANAKQETQSSIDHNIHIQSKPQSSIYRVAQHFMLSLQPFSKVLLLLLLLFYHGNAFTLVSPTLFNNVRGCIPPLGGVSHCKHDYFFSHTRQTVCAATDSLAVSGSLKQ